MKRETDDEGRQERTRSDSSKALENPKDQRFSGFLRNRARGTTPALHPRARTGLRASTKGEER